MGTRNTWVTRTMVWTLGSIPRSTGLGVESRASSTPSRTGASCFPCGSSRTKRQPASLPRPSTRSFASIARRATSSEWTSPGNTCRWDGRGVYGTRSTGWQEEPTLGGAGSNEAARGIRLQGALRSRENRRKIHRAQRTAQAPKRVALSDVYLDRDIVESKERAMRSPLLAAALSLLVAGLGQIYNGQVLKGVIFIIIQLINGALTTVLIGWLLLPLVGLWSMIDAYMTAKHNNERYGFR